MSVAFKGTDFSVPLSFGIGMYSDGTHMVKTDQWAEIVEHADKMVLQADTIQSFVVGMYLVDAVKAAGGNIKTLVLPYLPGARQDRSNPTGDVLFTAQSVASDINARGFERVISADPHSPVMPSLIANFDEFPLERIYSHLWGGYSGVIAPDKGAVRRAQIAGEVLNKPVVYGEKVRDVSTGKLSGFAVDVEEGKHYIVVDDICDGGGTFVGLGEKIREQGAFADLFVTHGIFSKGTHALKEIYKNVYTTDTRGQSATGLLKFNLVEEMENY